MVDLVLGHVDSPGLILDKIGRLYVVIIVHLF